MDCQSGIVSIYSGSDPGFLNRASDVLRASRSAGIQVIHIQVGFRPGLPEVSSRNKLFAAIRNVAAASEAVRGFCRRNQPCART